MAELMAVVTGLMAVASLVLLIVIERRLATLAAESRRQPPPAAAPSSRIVAPEQAWERRLQVFEQRVEHVFAAIERVEARLLAPVAAPTPAPAPPPSPWPAPSDAEPIPARAPAPAPPAAIPLPDDPSPPPLPPLVGSDAATGTDTPATADRLPSIDPEPLVVAYRALIAQPRRADITRWLDEHDGKGCEVGEGETLQLVGKEAGAPLALLPLSSDWGLVVPSGRTVVDFPTSYTDGLTLRLKTRGSFELEADGATGLRLLAPAVARRIEGRWRIEEPGRLGGFATA